ncbi:Sorting nexin-13 [Armadillidium vulgare]|nr:Sorting nexin-13 [Armadillidium vulgare]
MTHKNKMEAGIVCWILLGISLIIGSFGLLTCITLIISMFILILSFLISVGWIFSFDSDKWWFTLHRSHLQPSFSCLPKVNECLEMKPKNDIKLEKRITGSPVIDDQLQVIVEYILRDFVTPWYLEISPNPQFILQLQQGLQQSLTSLSNKCKSTDWVKYLTTQLVEDIASHLRLFREAKTSAKSKEAASKDLVEHFFDKEFENEKDFCRDSICLKKDIEKDYLSDLVEVILYYSIPPLEFANMPLRTAIVEIVVSSLIMPLFDRISEPDYINSLIVGFCTDIPISSELFTSVVKGTTSIEELESIRKAVSFDINQLRSRDSGGREEGTEVKQKIGSLEYLRQIIDSRVKRLGKGIETDSMGLPSNIDYRQIARGKLFQLPMDAILKNSLTLDHFLSYMASVDCQHYVNLYLNIECWKTSVCEHLCALELERIHHIQQENDLSMPDMCHDYFSSHDLSAHKAEADVIYEQYLSEKANPRVQIDDSIVKRLILRMRSEKLNENWFDETQKVLFTILKENELFLPSIWYIRLLGELDLLKDYSRLDDDDSQSLDDVSLSYIDQIESCGSSSSCSQSPISSLNPSPNHSRNSSLTLQAFNLVAHIIGNGKYRFIEFPIGKESIFSTTVEF